MARVCTFGLAAHERFLPCACVEPRPCFARRFVLLLRRASVEFDARDPASGRVDVALRCLSSALFRLYSALLRDAASSCETPVCERARTLGTRGSPLSSRRHVALLLLLSSCEMSPFSRRPAL